MNDYRILHGDALAQLKTLPSDSIHVAVTSPPYLGLRSYLPTDSPDKAAEIGFGQSLAEYVASLVAVFEEVRRVLRPDGTFWLNIGDSYNGSGGSGGDYSPGGLRDGQPKYPGRKEGNLKPKDLIGVPWRLAFALQEAGWWLRAEIIWHKRAPMPESVTDRPTRAHEQIFLLSKSANYFYDAEAVKEKAESNSVFHGSTTCKSGADGDRNDGGRSQVGQDNGGRNQRDVWTLAPEPYAAAHFAVFPTEIPRRAILAGTSEAGCCAACGAPLVRVVEQTAETVDYKGSYFDKGKTAVRSHDGVQTGPRYAKQSTGWRASCTCNAPIEPCTVLDPFAGSGTTLAVAVALGRRAIGCELNAAYIKLAEERIAATQRPLPVADVAPAPEPPPPAQAGLWGRGDNL